MLFKKLLPIALSCMLLIPKGKYIEDKGPFIRELKLEEENNKQNKYYNFDSSLNGNVINTSFNSKIKSITNIDFVSLSEIDKEIFDEVNYNLGIDLDNNEIIYTVSINSISISTSSTFDFSEGIINGEFEQDNLKTSLKEISNCTSIDQVGLFDFIKNVVDKVKKAIEEAIRIAEEIRQKAIEEAKKIAEEITRKAEEEARRARELIEKAIGDAKTFVSGILNTKDVLSGNIDNISREIEKCQSYKDYTKAKLLYERAQNVVSRAEELNSRVEKKLYSTSISEAIQVINPTRGLLKLLIERAKGMLKKVIAIFSSIKTEYSAVNMFNNITYALPEAIKNFVWNLACSIFGDFAGIKKNTAILTMAIANYKVNKNTCNSEESFFENGFISEQEYIKAKIGFGFDFSEKGCGIAATYNLLKYNKINIPLENLILHFDLMNAYNFAGVLGVNPKDITRILYYYGVYTLDSGTSAYKMFDDKLTNGDSGILCYLWINKSDLNTAIKETYIELYGEKKYEELKESIDWNAEVSIEHSLFNTFLFNSIYDKSDFKKLDYLVINFGDSPVLVKTTQFIKLINGSLSAHYIMLFKENDIVSNYNGPYFVKDEKYSVSRNMIESSINYNICLAGYYVL